jgi:hypothetical protein
VDWPGIEPPVLPHFSMERYLIMHRGNLGFSIHVEVGRKISYCLRADITQTDRQTDMTST